jgi:hypothetical protein
MDLNSLHSSSVHKQKELMENTLSSMEQKILSQASAFFLRRMNLNSLHSSSVHERKGLMEDTLSSFDTEIFDKKYPVQHKIIQESFSMHHCRAIPCIIIEIIKNKSDKREDKDKKNFQRKRSNLPHLIHCKQEYISFYRKIIS